MPGMTDTSGETGGILELPNGNFASLENRRCHCHLDVGDDNGKGVG